MVRTTRGDQDEQAMSHGNTRAESTNKRRSSGNPAVSDVPSSRQNTRQVVNYMHVRAQPGLMPCNGLQHRRGKGSLHFIIRPAECEGHFPRQPPMLSHYP